MASTLDVALDPSHFHPRDRSNFIHSYMNSFKGGRYWLKCSSPNTTTYMLCDVAKLDEEARGVNRTWQNSAKRQLIPLDMQLDLCLMHQGGEAAEALHGAAVVTKEVGMCCRTTRTNQT